MKRYFPSDYMVDAEGQPDDGEHEYVRASDLPRWIPVAERLPDLEDEEGCTPNVLGYYPDYPPDIQLVWYTGNGWEDGDGSGCDVKAPSHWMPLPEPPANAETDTDPTPKEKRAEVSFTLTDEEREALRHAVEVTAGLLHVYDDERPSFYISDTLRGIRERLN